MVDTAGDLSLLALASSSSSGAAAAAAAAAAASDPGRHLEAVRRDVWDICWSSDEPLKLAVMERERLRVLVCPELVVVGGGGSGRGEDEDDVEAAAAASARNARIWSRTMPYLLEYRSLRVVGVALDALLMASSS